MRSSMSFILVSAIPVQSPRIQTIDYPSTLHGNSFEHHVESVACLSVMHGLELFCDQVCSISIAEAR